MSPGRNAISFDPTASPSISPLQRAATAPRAATCCAARPGVGRPARIRTTHTGTDWVALRATAIRRSWPPPSPWAPSISSMRLGPHPPSDDLERLNERERGEGDEEGLQPVAGSERFRLEDALEEGSVDDHGLQGHRAEDRHDELRVGEQPDLPDCLPRRAHREDQEQLEEDDRGEGDSAGADGIGPRLELELEDAEGPDREDRRDDDDEEEDVAREDSLLRIAGPSVHDVGRVWIDPEGQRGEAVRHEVDPEQLHRDEERQILRVEDRYRRDEHDEHLAGVRREQEGDELADVLVDPTALLDRSNNRCEVVVGEDHIRALLRDIGAGDR